MLSAVATATLLEIGARRLVVDPGLSLWNLYACVQRSATLGQEFKPNCTGTMANAQFRTNSIGLRGGEVADDGTERVLAIGDSCTFGWGVSEGESYPGVLQRTLDYTAGGRRYSVINAGVPGFTSYQGLVYLRERGAQLRPSIVVIGYGFNDQAPRGDVRELIERSRQLLPISRLDEEVGTRSVLYRWARYKLIRPRASDLPPRVSLEQYQSNLEGMIALAREVGARPVLISFIGAYTAYGAVEKGVADRLGVPLIRYGGPRFDVVHPTAAGYSAFATQVYDRLHKAGYF